MPVREDKDSSQKPETFSLSSARKGDLFEIVSVDDQHARIQALRFGMSEGACVECITRIPAGPIVVKSGRQEIAVGRALAQRIQVRRRHLGHHRDRHNEASD
jgi:ferrous iron transport protein A